MQRLHFFATFEYGLARAIIFQVTANSVFASFRLQMYLDNSVAFLLFSFLNEAVWFLFFLRIVKESFTPGHPLRKIFNRNTLKVSYSCMPNLERKIGAHNKSSLANNSQSKEKS